MTPKEKAEELIKKYYSNATDFIDSNKLAKEVSIVFALIAIDEILNINSVDKSIELSDYWIEVKQELENMIG